MGVDEQLAYLGQLIASRRLEQDLTQAAVAEASGVSEPTIRRLEAGQSTQLANWLRVLTALGLVDRLAHLEPEPDPFVELREERGKPPRQRASGKRGAPSTDAPFHWGDER